VRERILTNEGDEFLMRVFPYQIAPDTYSGVVFTFINTSSLRKARKELVERELRMETLLRVTDAYVLINEQGIIKEVNDALIDLVGYREDDLLDNNISLLMAKEVSAEHDVYIDRYLKGTKSDIVGRSREVSVRHSNGDLIKQILSVAEMIIGEHHWFVGLLRTPS
jgi:PAS domain S-box-containing protein